MGGSARHPNRKELSVENVAHKMIAMRPSRVLDKFRAGQVVSCYKTNLSDARSVEIAALFGFDCVWTCIEHVGNDWSAVERQIWAAKAQGADLMVRVPRGSYSDHIKALELDASGIMVPHVMSLADARHVVWMTRFHPIGRRPVDSGNADGARASTLPCGPGKWNSPSPCCRST